MTNLIVRYLRAISKRKKLLAVNLFKLRRIRENY